MRTVGVAPSTTTISLRPSYGAGLGIIDPNDSWLVDRKWGNPGTTTFRVQNGSAHLAGLGSDGAFTGGFVVGMSVAGLLAGTILGFLAGSAIARRRR
jgi:hypothetical protein